MAAEKAGRPAALAPARPPAPAITPARIAALYAVLSALWIVGSDRALAALVHDPALITRLQTAKGWSFVSATALLIYFGVRGAVRTARRSAEALLESEAALRERDTLFRAVFDAAGVGISILDLDQRVLQTNPALDHMLGYAPGELVGKHVSEYWDLTHPTSTVESRRARLQALLAGEARYSLERSYRRKDGSTVPVHVTVSLVRGEGEPRHEVGVIEDLTERRRVEAALAESEARLRQAQKMEAVGRLAGGIAHDFNNLLTVILSNADLALDALGDATAAGGPAAKPAGLTDALRAAREELSELRGAAERAASVTQQLLAFSRKQVMQPTLLDLDQVVSGVERLVKRLISDGITLQREPGASLGLVRADRGRMEQVVMNLVLNARDAMSETGGTLTLSTGEVRVDDAAAARLPGMRAGDYVTLSVRDTGTGMDAGTLGRLFEPFFTTKPQGQGTGLGLSTVYGIVKQSDGFVYADSEPGRGSTFTVYLPRVEPVQGTATAGARAALPDAGDGATVLVVDDEPAVREATRRLLERNGFRVRVAADGAEALREWERDRGAVDLVLTDLAMPGMDGRALAARLRALDPAVRVLWMSGFAGPEVAAGEAVLEKPFTVAELLARVRETLEM